MGFRLHRREFMLGLAGVSPARLPAPAGKPDLAVGARWERVPATARMGQRVTVTLRVTASEDAPRVTIRLLPTAGLTLTTRATPRTMALRRGQMVTLPVTFVVQREGTWTLGASVTNTQPGDEQVSGAVLHVVATGETAVLST